MRKTVMKAMMICGAVGMLFLGGTAAYLTDYDQTVNEFTVGKVEIDLTEPNWKPEENTRLTPEDVIPKDPMVTNTGVNDAFVYLEIALPKAEVITADSQGNRREKEAIELFTFEKNDGWTLIQTKNTEASGIYTYAYEEILHAGESTGTLFDSITFANVVEGELDTRKLEIPVRAYAIQTAHTGGEETEIVEQAKAAFQKYVNQNQKLDGQVM